MAAHSYLPHSSAATKSADVMETMHGRVRRSFTDGCKPYLPVITVVLSVVGCIVTIVSEANTIQSGIKGLQMSQEATATANWLGTLQKIGFDESNLIPTALLMSNFDNDTNVFRAEQARRVERIVLEQTQRPETFDVVSADMMGKGIPPDRIQEMTEVIEQLDFRLEHEFEEVAGSQSAGDAAPTLETFLAEPEAFYSGVASRERLEHVLVTMWELDTISGLMTCALETTQKAPQLEAMVFLNYAPANQDAVRSYRSCAVMRSDKGSELECRAPVAPTRPSC